MRALKDIDTKLNPYEQARLEAAAKNWVERKDPKAQALTAPEGGVEANQAQSERIKQRVAEHRDELIRREYAAAGLAPVTDGKGGLVSLSLARSLGMELQRESLGQGEAA